MLALILQFDIVYFKNDTENNKSHFSNEHSWTAQHLYNLGPTDDAIHPLYTESKKHGKDQKSIQSSTEPDPGYQWESYNVTIRHHKREPRGKLFPSR